MCVSSILPTGFTDIDTTVQVGRVCGGARLQTQFSFRLSSTLQGNIAQMAASDTIVNPFHPSVVDKIDPDFARIYNLYQGSFNDQIESDTSRLTIPSTNFAG